MKNKKKMIKRITNPKSYDDELCIVQEYINPVKVDFQSDEDYDIMT